MKLTFLWQRSAYAERDWIMEIFGPVAGEQIVDGKHEFVLDDCLLIDSGLHTRPANYYKQFRGKNAWLLHLSDETYSGGYEAYANFRGVFRNYWSSAFTSSRVFQLPLGYSDGVAPRLAGPGALPRKYLWSFLGQGDKSSRPDLLDAFQSLSPNFVLRTNIPGSRACTPSEYREVLLNSTFVPCPMGNVNLDSFRVYEALECGSIPIVEKRLQLDYFRRLLGDHPIPTFSTWAKAAQFISALQADPQKLHNVRNNCFAWWRSYKQLLQERIVQFLADSQQHSGAQLTDAPHTLPGRQFVDLMMHQSPRTLTRRLRMQLSRRFIQRV